MFMLARQSSATTYCDRRKFAAAAGISLSGADYHGSEDWSTGVANYLSHFRVRTTDSRFLADIESPVGNGAGTPRLCLAAFRAAAGMDPQDACHRYSVGEKEWKAILDAHQVVVSKTGINLFEQDPNNARQSRFPKLITEAKCLRLLWELVEANSVDAALDRVITSWLSNCSRTDRANLSAPIVDIDDINSILAPTEWRAEIKRSSTGPFRSYDVLHQTTGRSGNHVWAYFLTITACVRIAHRLLSK
jgi:hypothetical protein